MKIKFLARISPLGAKTASVSMIWLVLVYFFHTMGELCISPVALSYVSKLVPGRMIAMMFGIWYLAVAIGMKLAGVFGEVSEYRALLSYHRNSVGFVVNNKVWSYCKRQIKI